MPRRNPQELVYVLLAIDEEGLPTTVEVHGTRSQAEFAAEALARAEGYSTKDRRFEESGELVMGKPQGVVHCTGIFVLPRVIIRKPRVLKEKP